MASGKKKEKLSLEEKLEQALVPVEEQPYEVPGNWCWVKLEFLADIKTGNKDANYGCEDGKYYFFTCASEPIRCSDYSFEGKAILLAGNGDIGNISLYNGKFEAYQRTYVLKQCGGVIEEYLYYYFKFRWVDYNKNKMFGSTIPYIRLRNLKQYEVPISPVPEQQRIVVQIENLFAKLDEVKEKVQVIIDGFELRKAAIFHKAFTGELTERWRKMHGVGMDSWENRTLDSVCSTIFDGDHMPPPKAESGVPFLVISNVNNGHLSYENTRFVPQEYYDSLSETRKPQMGDILYTLVGSYGIPVVVDDERPFCFQRHMALMKPNEINTYFLWYLLQSQEMFNKVSEIATGTAQLTVPIKGLRMVAFRKPTVKEQTEIVRILDNLLGKEQQVKEAAEAVLDKIDTMKKTILARAFHGELGTNDSAEESAVEMLRKII